MEADSGDGHITLPGFRCKDYPILEMFNKRGYHPVVFLLTSTLAPSALTEELKSLISCGFCPVILKVTNGSRLGVCSVSELKKFCFTLPKNMLPTITTYQKAALDLIDPFAEGFYRQDRELDIEAPTTSHCSVSGFTPALFECDFTSNGSIVVSLSSGVQWTVIEGNKLLAIYSKASDFSLLEPSEMCQLAIGTLLSTAPVCTSSVEPKNTCDFMQGIHRMIDKLTSSSRYQKPSKDESEFVDKQTDASSVPDFQDEVIGNPLQSSGSLLTNHRSHNSGNRVVEEVLDDPFEENSRLVVLNGVSPLKNKFRSLLSLPFLLVYGILCLAGKKVDSQIGAAIMIISGIGIPGFVQTIKYGLFGTPILQFDFGTLVYAFVFVLWFLSLILECTEWWAEPSLPMAGAAYICATLGILSKIFGQIPLPYVFSGVHVIMVLVLLAVLYGCTPDRAYQRMVGQ